jgi:dienelactone hydrolase
MRSIGRTAWLTVAAGGVGVLAVLSFTPATAAVLGHTQKRSSATVAAEATAVDAAAAADSCTAAKDALKAAQAKDKTGEDASEKSTAGLAGAASTDRNADKSESAALKPFRDAAHAACTTPACLAAEKAVKDANVTDKTTEDKNEKKSTNDQNADTSEKASLKKLKTARHTACAGSEK